MPVTTTYCRSGGLGRHLGTAAASGTTRRLCRTQDVACHHLLTTVATADVVALVEQDDLMRSVQAADLEVALSAIAEVREVLRQVEPVKVREARRAGYSWDQIATWLQSTRQAVHRKYRHLETEERPGRMMTLSKPVREVIRAAGKAAKDHGMERLDVNHLFVQLLTDGSPAVAPAREALEGVNAQALLAGTSPGRIGDKRKRNGRGNSDEVLMAYRTAMDLARSTHSKQIQQGHLMAASLSFESDLTRSLEAHGVDIGRLRQQVLRASS